MFANVGRDGEGRHQPDVRQRKPGIVLEDVGEAADVDIEDAESDSEADTEGEVGVWSASGRCIQVQAEDGGVEDGD